MAQPQLKNIVDNLRRGYKRLALDTMCHVDELVNEQRSSPERIIRAPSRSERPDDYLLMEQAYTADGQLYTAQGKTVLWGITRLPQNLLLRNIDEAYPLLISELSEPYETKNYFPTSGEAKVAFQHADTVVVDVEGLALREHDLTRGYFQIDPRMVRSLNTEQKQAAQRLFGPDEENFEKNMEMFARNRENVLVFTLAPNHLRKVLEENKKEYVAMPSLLTHRWDNTFVFDTTFHYVGNHFRLRGVPQMQADELLMKR